MSYDGRMRPSALFVIGAVLLLAGVAVSILGGDEGMWRVARSVLAGGGAGLLAATFITSRRNKKAGEQSN